MDKQRKFPEPQPFEDEERPPIELKPVESSQIKAIGYDEKTGTLAVAFKYGTGAIYHYPDVLEETHQAFVNAESIGQFFGKHIKALPFKKYRAAPVAA